MKTYYRVILGKKSAHAPECFIVANFCPALAELTSRS